MTSAADLRGFVDELAAGGIADAIVCPGSRSTPLALAFRANPAIRVRVLLDERGAGFFALGLAKVARRPVAVLTTSGTAAANLLPAAVEASLARVPLVLITADRPPELQDRGAPQTIDQAGLFGSHAKWFAQLLVPDGSPEAGLQLRSVAGRAVAVATEGPAGPVHLNAPFREPLVPDGDLGPQEPLVGVGAGSPVPLSAATTGTTTAAGERAWPSPYTSALAGRRTLAQADVAALAARVHGRHGLIVVGPQDDPTLPAEVARLASTADFPVFADPLSGMRCGPHDRSRVLARGDLLVRRGPWLDAHQPDVVIRFGAMPTSKALQQLLEAARPELLVVDADGGWREPAILPATFVHADAAWLAGALADAIADVIAVREPAQVEMAAADPAPLPPPSLPTPSLPPARVAPESSAIAPGAASPADGRGPTAPTASIRRRHHAAAPGRCRVHGRRADRRRGPRRRSAGGRPRQRLVPQHPRPPPTRSAAPVAA